MEMTEWWQKGWYHWKNVLLTFPKRRGCHVTQGQRGNARFSLEGRQKQEPDESLGHILFWDFCGKGKQGRRNRWRLAGVNDSSGLWGTGALSAVCAWPWVDLGQGKYWLSMWETNNEVFQILPYMTLESVWFVYGRCDPGWTLCYL